MKLILAATALACAALSASAAEQDELDISRNEALANAASAVRGLILLADITGDDRLARCACPADSTHAPVLSGEESQNGVHSATLDGRDWLWIGNTSRDQYLGVFFGLAVAWDMIDDAGLSAEIRALSGRLLRYLLDRAWTPAFFSIRPDEQLTLLQIGHHIDPEASDGHGSPHFSMIDRALNGPDARRDAETRDLLDAWLARPRTDERVDWRRPCMRRGPQLRSAPRRAARPHRLPLAAQPLPPVRRRQRQRRGCRHRLHPPLLDGPVPRRALAGPQRRRAARHRIPLPYTFGFR